MQPPIDSALGAGQIGPKGVAWAKAEGNFNYTAALAVDLDLHHARGRGVLAEKGILVIWTARAFCNRLQIDCSMSGDPRRGTPGRKVVVRPS